MSLSSRIHLTPKYLDRELPTATAQGRRWLIKALHPADGTIRAERAPSSSRYPTVTQEVVSRFTISKPSVINTDTWSFRLFQTTDPLCPIVVTFMQPTSVTPWDTGALCYEWINPIFAPEGVDPFGAHTAAHYEGMLDKFQHACETYRITAFSTTGEFVGATLTDNGSISAMQCQDRTRHLTHMNFEALDGSVLAKVEDATTGSEITVPIPQGRWLQSESHIWCDPIPTLAQSSMASHPYNDKAKEGWYMPQKLQCPSHWKSNNDLVFRGRLTPGAMALGPVDKYRAASNQSQIIGWPLHLEFYTAAGPHLWVQNCDDGLGCVYVNNIHATTSFQVIVRFNLELGVSPMSEYATFADSTPPPDPVAIELYNEIVKDMLDAYPSRDNANSTLRDKIATIARKVAAVVEPIAGIASYAGVPYAGVIARLAGSIAEKGMAATKGKEFQAEAGKAAGEMITDIRAAKAKKLLTDKELEGLSKEQIIALAAKKRKEKAQQKKAAGGTKK